MTTDIEKLIERLRGEDGYPWGARFLHNPDGPEAADALEAQAAEISRLTGAVKIYVQATDALETNLNGLSHETRGLLRERKKRAREILNAALQHKEPTTSDIVKAVREEVASWPQWKKNIMKTYGDEVMKSCGIQPKDTAK